MFPFEREVLQIIGKHLKSRVWCILCFFCDVNWLAEFFLQVARRGKWFRLGFVCSVEVLMAKSHLFRDPIGSQKFREWQDLVQKPLPGFQRDLVGLPSEDAESMLRSLASFGTVKVNSLHPLTWEMSGNPLKLTEGKAWADVFEEVEEQAEKVDFLAAPAHQESQEESEDAQSQVRNLPKPRRRRRRRRAGATTPTAAASQTVDGLSPASDEPAWVESVKSEDPSRELADIEMEPQKVVVEDDLPELLRRRRRRRPRGRKGKQPQETSE